MSGPALTVCALGPTPYRDGLRLQEALVRARAAGETGDWLLFPDHEPVLTVGRGGTAASLLISREDLARRGVELFEVARGGDITWHGPGQLVGYPIIQLDRLGRDLHRFIRELEATLIEALEVDGIHGVAISGRTGVWVGEEKIASIGIAVRRWVSYHGFAHNVAPDLAFFDLIHPCGLQGIKMTSMAERLGSRVPSLGDMRERVARILARRLEFDGMRWVGPAAAWEAAGLEWEAAGSVRPRGL